MAYQDAHGSRLAPRAQPPRPLSPTRPADAMELDDVPRHRPLAFDKIVSSSSPRSYNQCSIVLMNVAKYWESGFKIKEHMYSDCWSDGAPGPDRGM
ncbi:hypothetical protein MSG28_003307 [Choristoneura fumiferana]|uniref:Uncharacterized protein n=2 Tax=Choristoneura fumiferana TaxID=7141 RepID=A0ACC0KEZ7_CHOFU|nr:hypothetical protein MSG28_003307 [Choristoneura fumiferana]KAI8434796.1 hypothetical protein MSG28_003307 [Choristoneura fumiferana]